MIEAAEVEEIGLVAEVVEAADVAAVGEVSTVLAAGGLSRFFKRSTNEANSCSAFLPVGRRPKGRGQESGLRVAARISRWR